MSEFQEKLPRNWIATTLGELCSQPQYGYTTKGSDIGTLRLLRTTDITSGKICWEDVPFCSENPTDEAKYLLEDGDIVISRAGSVGVSYLLKNPERSVFASYLIRFKPYIDKQYFKYFLDSPYYWQEIADNKLGIAVPNVNASKLKEIAIPLPPENEQHRIVAKIEELFSELDKGIESLKTARAQLKVYRQALLKHAFEGKLTAQWREQNSDKLESAEALLKRIQLERAARYQQQLADWETSGKQGSLVQRAGKPKAAKSLPPLTQEELAELPELPEGWGWVRLADIGDIETGTTPPKDNPSNYGNEYPFFKPTDLEAGSNVRIAREYLSKQGLSRSRFLPANSTLITCIGATIGKVGITRVDGASNQQINSIIPFCAVLPDFVYYQASGPIFQDAVKSNASSTTLPILNKSKFEVLAIAVCSFDEQQKVVLEVESKLSEVDQLELTLTTALQQAEALRQSILKKAFAGLLVPQDPHDEPAAVLLEHIRAGIAASPNNRKCGK